MFRDGPRRDDPALGAAANRAFQVLEDDIRGLYGMGPEGALDADARAALLAMWSIVHGFAHLAIGGRFAWLAGGIGLERWVSRTLPGVLRAAIDGIGVRPPQQGPKRR